MLDFTYVMPVRSSGEPADTPPYVPRAIIDNAGYLLARLGSASEAAFREALEPLGLRPRHYAVLSALADQRELATQHTVGGCLAIDPSTMVAVIDELEGQGFVSRRRDPADRRRYLLALTAKGRRKHAACRSAAERCEAQLLGSLDHDERAVLRRLLKKVLVGDDQDLEVRVDAATTTRPARGVVHADAPGRAAAEED